MASESVWGELHARRFASIPEDCGNESTPGIVEHAAFRNWAMRPTTDDQYRIENYIDRYDLRSKRVLHVGIGNSGLAKRFQNRIKAIVGTTVDQSELERAEKLGIPGYTIVIQNKYGSEPELCPGIFDFIVDNNPTSSCCCMKHLRAVFELYSSKLAEHGQMVTDRQGLGWTPPPAHSRFRFDFEDLAAVAKAAGLNVYRIDANIYVLAHKAPLGPGALPLLRHMLRRAAMLPWTLVELPRKIMRRLFRSTPDQSTAGHPPDLIDSGSDLP